MSEIEQLSKQLMSMQNEIADKETLIERKRGSLDALYQDLKEKYSIDTLDQAKKELKRLDKECVALETAFEKGMKAIAEKYDWQNKRRNNHD